MDNQFWKNKQVLITGANGFVAANLIKALVAREANVIAFSKHKLTSPSLLFSENIADKIAKNERGNVENFTLIDGILKRNKVDIIFHLAAQSLVEKGTESPLSTLESNIKGTWNILEAARINNIKKTIIASTTHVYGNNPSVPYGEELFPQPSRPYETSKACADLLAQSFADTYSLPVEIPRFANLYGPGDFNFSRIIPKIIKTILSGENPVIWDQGIIRDFLYIDDAINGYLLLAEKKLPNSKRSRVVNFGSGFPVSIKSIANKIIKQSNNNTKLVLESVPQERENEVKKQYTSIARAKDVLGWEPETQLDTGLKKTFIWYKDFLKISENYK